MKKLLHISFTFLLAVVLVIMGSGVNISSLLMFRQDNRDTVAYSTERR